MVRWTVGVKYGADGPIFTVRHLAPFETLSEQFNFAAQGASCLILNGRPLRLEPFPQPGDDPFPPSYPPVYDEAGFVRKVDHIRTSRTSMAWSKDSERFYLLVIKDPGSEAASIAALAHSVPLMGGWTVADLQHFWHAVGVWCAVNIDGGDVTQCTALRRNGRYDLIPARWADHRMRCVYTPGDAHAPQGGTLMYLYIRDTAAP